VAFAVLAPVGVLVFLSLGAELDSGGQTLRVLANTLGLTVLTVIGAVAVGVPLALATVHTRLPGRRLWLALLAAPLAIPSYVGAFAYFAAFGRGGEIETLLGFGTPPVRGFVGAALVMTLYTYPFVLLTTRASLKQLDGRMVDAARSLGLALPAALWRVVLPRVRGGIAAGALLVALYTLSDFATPAILGPSATSCCGWSCSATAACPRFALQCIQWLRFLAAWLVLRF
jgi:iron(III) transport system permease protein